MYGMPPRAKALQCRPAFARSEELVQQYPEVFFLVSIADTNAVRGDRRTEAKKIVHPDRGEIMPSRYRQSERKVESRIEIHEVVFLPFASNKLKLKDTVPSEGSEEMSYPFLELGIRGNGLCV